MSTGIPSFLLCREPVKPRPGKEEADDADWDIGPPPFKGPYATSEGVVTLVEAVDTSWPGGAAFLGSVRLPGYLNHIDVGTVLVHRPIDPAIPPLERPWQAGRVYRDGVRWEERLWPDDDVDAFQDHVARLLRITVPGDERPQPLNLPEASDASSVIFCDVP